MGERDACRQLLKTLFELWPDCPMHTLIGDSLYDQEEAFAMELEFDWGLHRCFPRREGLQGFPARRERRCPLLRARAHAPREGRTVPRRQVAGTDRHPARRARTRGRSAHTLALPDQRAELQVADDAIERQRAPVHLLPPHRGRAARDQAAGPADPSQQH
jgi:hypothetical protein